MNRKISGRQLFSRYEGSALTSLFMSDAIIIAGRYSPAGIYSWVSSAAGAVIASLLIRVSIKNNPGYSKISIVKALYIALSFAALSASLVMFADFVKQCILPDIMLFVIPAGILTAGLYSASKSFNTLIKSVHIIIPVILFFIVALFGLLIPSARFEYVFTFSETAGIPDVFLSIITDTAVFFVKGILIYQLFSDESQYYDTDSTKTVIIRGILSYGLLISAIQFLSLTVLGPGLYECLDYPLYYPPGLTFVGDYFERAEILTILMFMSSLVIKAGIYLRIIKHSIKKLRLSV